VFPLSSADLDNSADFASRLFVSPCTSAHRHGDGWTVWHRCHHDRCTGVTM